MEGRHNTAQGISPVEHRTTLPSSPHAVAFTTGLNLLLNLFFGPVVNAARAVAVQVQNAIQQFVGKNNV